MQYQYLLYDVWLSCAPQVNPPYYLKLVELVPHPETAASVMDTTHFLMTKVKIQDYTILGMSWRAGEMQKISQYQVYEEAKCL